MLLGCPGQNYSKFVGAQKGSFCSVKVAPIECSL
jgi:hypothetical protein